MLIREGSLGPKQVWSAYVAATQVSSMTGLTAHAVQRFAVCYCGWIFLGADFAGIESRRSLLTGSKMQRGKPTDQDGG
jgi:hypothetical protein